MLSVARLSLKKRIFLAIAAIGVIPTFFHFVPRWRAASGRRQFQGHARCGVRGAFGAGKAAKPRALAVEVRGALLRRGVDRFY